MNSAISGRMGNDQSIKTVPLVLLFITDEQGSKQLEKLGSTDDKAVLLKDW